MDFTGGIPQVITIQESQTEEEVKSLLHTLKLVSANEALISTHLRLSGTHFREAQSFGLQSSHVYSVTNVVDVSEWYQKKSQHLIRYDIVENLVLKCPFRLRNPQGVDDWKGAWCDNSEEWNAISSGKKEDIELMISKRF